MHACVNAMESTARGMAARSFAGASSDRLRVTILDLDGWREGEVEMQHRGSYPVSP